MSTKTVLIKLLNKNVRNRLELVHVAKHPSLKPCAMLTLQVNTLLQGAKKGMSTPTRQTPNTASLAPKCVPIEQHDTKAKVAFLRHSSLICSSNAGLPLV